MRAFRPVTDHALIGDGHSAALVGSDACVVWWCPARFDAPSVFASLLEREEGGHWSVDPQNAHARETSYVGDSNVHRVDLWDGEGRARVTTFMPHAEAHHPRPHERRIVRLIEGVEGEIDLLVTVAPRLDYGRLAPAVSRRGNGWRFEAGGDALVLRSTLGLEAQGHEATARLRLREGQRHAMVLSWGEAPDAPPLAEADDALARELAFWERWVSHFRHDGPYVERVRRSMLALKLMQHVPSGSFVAAPTLGLPEIPGLDENWDYRYAWLRDGSFIVMAFETTGFTDEALRFRRWLAEVVKRDAPDEMQTLYRVDGGPDVPETTLDHLEGWENSQPVYLGNKAVDQHQLDTYGETLMCFHRADALFEEQGEHLWPPIRALVERVCETWRDADSGIWELRSQKAHYVYSKAMAWLAVRHGVDIARKHGYDAPFAEWERAADDIRAWIETEGYDEKLGGYKESQERSFSDAATLLFPIFGYCEAGHARFEATTARIRGELAAHGLLHRHLEADSHGSEGAFLACSFWLAYDLAQAGRPEEARRWFEDALSVAGPLGLLPEEADTVTRAGLGNYPQALTHLSLVLAAWAIGDAEKP